MTDGRWAMAFVTDGGFMRVLCAMSLLSFVAPLPAQQGPSVPFDRRIVAGQGLHYLVSRPSGWKAGGSYPVVVVIVDADREFVKSMQSYIAARGNRAYVLVVPEMVTAGPSVWRSGQQAPFSYSATEWDHIRTVTDCGFDNTGMTALLSEVRRLDTPNGKFYLTGLEAGGHVVWRQFFTHPELWAAVSAVAPNYIGRCMDDRQFASPGASGGPFARDFFGTLDSSAAPGGGLYGQWVAVQRLAAQAGFSHLSEQAVPGKPRGLMPTEILAWFDSLRAAGSSGH